VSSPSKYQEGSTTIVKVVSPGINYLSGGVIQVTGGGGSGFSGTTEVNVNGSLTGVLISNHGSGFSTDPDTVLLFYNGTNVNMVSLIYRI
jgi:hypothetical protein